MYIILHYRIIIHWRGERTNKNGGVRTTATRRRKIRRRSFDDQRTAYYNVIVIVVVKFRFGAIVSYPLAAHIIPCRYYTCGAILIKSGPLDKISAFEFILVRNLNFMFFFWDFTFLNDNIHILWFQISNRRYLSIIGRYIMILFVTLKSNFKRV